MDLKELVQNVLDGEESGLVALAVLKEQLNIIKECITQVEPTAFDEAESYGEKKFKHKDLMIERRNGKKNFNFKGITEWQQADATKKAVEAKAKAAYSNYENNVESVTPDGEIVQLPIVTYSKDSLIIKRIAHES